MMHVLKSAPDTVFLMFGHWTCVQEKLRYITKSIWTPDHDLHVWVSSRLLPRNQRHMIVQNVFECCTTSLQLELNVSLVHQLSSKKIQFAKFGLEERKWPVQRSDLNPRWERKSGTAICPSLWLKCQMTTSDLCFSILHAVEPLERCVIQAECEGPSKQIVLEGEDCTFEDYTLLLKCGELGLSHSSLSTTWDNTTPAPRLMSVCKTKGRGRSGM